MYRIITGREDIMRIFYTPEELAATLKVQPGEIIAAIEAGELRAVRPTGAFRISDADADEWIWSNATLPRTSNAMVDDDGSSGYKGAGLPPGFAWGSTASGKARYPVKGSVAAGAVILLGKARQPLELS